MPWARALGAPRSQPAPPALASRGGRPCSARLRRGGSLATRGFPGPREPGLSNADPSPWSQPTQQLPRSPTKGGQDPPLPFLGSFKLQACSQVPVTHSAFSQVTRIFLDFNFWGPQNKSSPHWLPQIYTSGRGSPNSLGVSPQALNSFTQPLQVLQINAALGHIPYNLNITPVLWSC